MAWFKAMLAVSCAVCMVFAVSGAAFGDGKSGEAAFKKLCGACHPAGGNIINPKKTLSKKDREANGLKSKDDIVKFMRKPGPGMSAFDEKALSDASAKEIAEYIEKTFK